MQPSASYRALLASLALALASSISAQDKTYTPSGYRIETIPLPADTRFEIAGLDIDKTGTVYCATRIGDVWTYDGQTWSKFADGLHEPCGVLCDDDGTIVVAQKPELTRLVDKDHDGTADDYICLTSDWEYHDNYHEFHFGPVKDSKGNYFGTLNLSHKDPLVPNIRTEEINAFGIFVPNAMGCFKSPPLSRFLSEKNGIRPKSDTERNVLPKPSLLRRETVDRARFVHFAWL